MTIWERTCNFMKNKTKRIEIRATEKLVDYLDEVCARSGRTRTSVLESLIWEEYCKKCATKDAEK